MPCNHRRRGRAPRRDAYRGLLPDDVLAGLSIPERERFWSDALTARPPRTGITHEEEPEKERDQ